MIAAACLAALLAAPARAAQDPAECPSGTHRVMTDDPYQAFRCEKGDPPDPGFAPMSLSPGFAARPHCPRGTRPEEEPPGSLQPYRCVRADVPLEAADGEQDAAAKPPAKEDAPTPPRPSKYRRYAVPGQISFEYATVFRVQDAWKEEVPTLYLKIDDSSAGKPVTVTVALNAAGQSSYQELEQAVARDVEWQGAKDGGSIQVGKSKARVTEVPRDTRSVYLPVSKDSYYSFVYSAPAESFDLYLPSFARLLKSLKLAGQAP